MKNTIRLLITGSLIVLLGSCQYFTYTFHSKREVRRQKPSILIPQCIVDFRNEYQCWPSSKEDMMAKGKKYTDAFVGFAYATTWFKIKDDNTMVFYFSDHRIDVDKYNAPRRYDINTYPDSRGTDYNNSIAPKTDLNAYHGYIKFFKVKDRFTWKIKMQR